MIHVDRVMFKRQVLHRHHAASLCSRATLMRRVRAGEWWRPTPWTVALRQEAYDADFDLLTAAAHVWPDGGVGGATLRRVFGIGPQEAGSITATIDRRDRVAGAATITFTRCEHRALRVVVLPSRRELTVDIGPASLAAAARGQSIEDVSWLLVKSTALSHRTSRPLHAIDGFIKYVETSRKASVPGWRSVAVAVRGGCESAGEVFVWLILESLGVSFSTQHATQVSDRRLVDTPTIRNDFLVDGGVVIEVDSGLHDHLKDVRRDLMNLTDGVRTIRVVGLDVMADPVRYQRLLARALNEMGVSVRPRPLPLPPWLTAG